MKVLHTADWHLGKRLEQCERTEEHQQFLDWLIDKLSEQCIDVLIIAGDVFDTGTPSNAALKQYYDFLWRVKNTCCKEVIIIGGNHDSVTTLNAPKDLLKYFSVHVVGGVPDNLVDQIIPISNAAGELELVVCAVPFLRDKDVRLSISGESSSDMEARLKKGICDHYNAFKEHVAPYKAEGIPVIATGHLFTAGGANSESEKDIHVGNLGQVCGDQFPEEFDYIALGHLHRPQVVNKINHIRYSGSPIPLSFSENQDEKLVLILTFEGGKLSELEEFNIPCCRKLIRIKGNFETVKNKLILLEDDKLCYPAWVEVQVETDGYIHELEDQLNKLIHKKVFIERLFISQRKLKPLLNLNEQVSEAMTLTDLDPKTVFRKKLQSAYPQGDADDLLQTFDEVMELMRQSE
ncbi:exonuclease SbcCD subunit D C-terminal domain-containing protein [Segetibacter aerophilus]|uniref:Nuclease SbcCD subunit D n=1 Tax=Segetibacter aerophilus TaxID=670293 RepID=A0A512BCI2_9BACT|nr:exonuclease SbcCD subunit D C-terminal domain-containing protein [Segetibacter aerophilus]GEO09679.1 nuclease SbcCD subunit D [Segetibacter aerophilus]